MGMGIRGWRFKDILPQWRDRLEKNITESLRSLLEKKHLYQSYLVDTQVAVTLSGDAASLVKAAVTKVEWGVDDKAASDSSNPACFLTVSIPDVKLFCERCDDVEPFNSMSAHIATGRNTLEPKMEGEEAVQVFVFSFLCQSCKRIPEVFLVRRQGLKLTLCGRAPMEVVNVPKFIPKEVREYFYGAVIAHQSGETLPGIFMLRTLVEQWARFKVNSSPARADELMDKYMDTLPPDFKSRFTSMRSLYDRLSEALHMATGSAELFDDALEKITKHFDARRVFGLK